MQKARLKTRSRRAIWIAVTAAAVAALGAAYLWFPRGLRGPETVAQNFIEAFLDVSPDEPDYSGRLRAAAHLDQADDPQSVIDGLSTRIALDFLRLRRRQGAVQRIAIGESRRPAPTHYVTALRVVERVDNSRGSLTRRFNVVLLKSDNGDWRVTSVAVIE